MASDEEKVWISSSTESTVARGLVLVINSADYLLSVRDHKAAEMEYKALPEIPGENDRRLLIPVLALKVAEAGPKCLPTFLLDTEICVRELVSMSSLVVSAVTRAGDINYSLPGDADLHNRSGLRAGLPPPSLPHISINACGVFLRLPLWPWHPH